MTNLIYQYIKSFFFLGKRYSYIKLLLISINYLFTRLQYSLRFTRVFRSPPNVYLFITKQCNLNCWFCHYRDTLVPVKEDNDDMTAFDLVKILNSGVISWPSRISFYGGEPFLNHNIYDLIKIAAERGHFISVTTNGTLLKSNLHKILDSDINFITLSYYPEVFGIIKDVLPDLALEKFVNVSFIITKDNLFDLEQVFEDAILSNCQMMTVENLATNSGCDDRALKYDEHYQQYKDYIVNKFRKKIIIRWSSIYRPDYNEEKICCTEFWDMMIVDRNGRLLPCCQYSLNHFNGNIFDSGLNSPALINLRKLMVANQIPHECGKCHFLYAKDPLYKNNG